MASGRVVLPMKVPTSNATSGFISSPSSSTATAVAEGTAPNAYTIVGGTNGTASGATLAGGTATGGISISSSTASAKVLVIWSNKQ